MPESKPIPPLIPGRATAEAMRAFAERHDSRMRNNGSHTGYRRAADWHVSTIGMGTYLGDPEADRDAVQRAVRRALELGVNVFDTAVNYRHQAAERDVGAALAKAFADGIALREEVLVATKGGFLPLDFAEHPDNPRRYLAERFLSNGICPPGEVVAGCHTLAPACIDALFEMSRANLGLETIDIYFLHNPEMHLDEVPRRTFLERLRLAFEVLAGKVAEGKLAAYGIATWDGLRQEPGTDNGVVIDEVIRMAVEVEGPGHHFRAIQLPVNLAMTEAMTINHDPGRHPGKSLLEIARDAELMVMTSASLMQGQLAANLPEQLAKLIPGARTSAQRALQHTRCAPGVSTALVGMKAPAHVEENAELLSAQQLSPDYIAKLYGRG